MIRKAMLWATIASSIVLLQTFGCGKDQTPADPNCLEKPTAVVDPIPADGDTIVATADTIGLGWHGGETRCDLIVTYTIYIGVNSEPVAVGATHSPYWAYEIRNKDVTQTIFWKVQACDGNGCSTSPVWSFTLVPPGGDR
jgi:hypothetical protein